VDYPKARRRERSVDFLCAGTKLLSLAPDEYGGLKVSQARRLKDLEIENQRLSKAVSNLTLDALIFERGC